MWVVGDHRMSGHAACIFGHGNKCAQFCKLFGINMFSPHHGTKSNSKSHPLIYCVIFWVRALATVKKYVTFIGTHTVLYLN